MSETWFSPYKKPFAILSYSTIEQLFLNIPLIKDLNVTEIIIIYRVPHKGWDFRDDFTDFVLSIFLYPDSLKLSTCFFRLVIFQVIFTASFFVGNPVFQLWFLFIFGKFVSVFLNQWSGLKIWSGEYVWLVYVTTVW